MIVSQHVNERKDCDSNYLVDLLTFFLQNCKSFYSTKSDLRIETFSSDKTRSKAFITRLNGFHGFEGFLGPTKESQKVEHSSDQTLRTQIPSHLHRKLNTAVQEQLSWANNGMSNTIFNHSLLEKTCQINSELTLL